jgi:hypothetical protein
LLVTPSLSDYPVRRLSIGPTAWCVAWPGVVHRHGQRGYQMLRERSVWCALLYVGLTALSTAGCYELGGQLGDKAVDATSAA